MRVPVYIRRERLMFISQLGFLAYLGLAIIIGKNSGDVMHKAYLSMVETVIYNPVIVLVKISILLQYITVFVAHRGNLFHYGCHILIWVNVVFYSVMTLVYIFQCKPRQKLWIPSTPGHCHSEHTRGVYSGSINVISDFAILILPLPIIIRLQRPSVKKIRPLVVFGFGLFACIAAVVRLVYSTQLKPESDSASYQLTIDKEGLWAFAEIAIGIIVGCMPLVHKFFRHISSEISIPSSFKVFSSSTGSSVWRRILSRPSTSEDSSSHGKLFDSKDSGSVAPQIQTLNMTRASLSFVETEKELPALPAPTYRTETISRKPVPRAHNDREDVQQTPEVIPTDLLDVERQTPSWISVWRDRQRVMSNRSIALPRSTSLQLAQVIGQILYYTGVRSAERNAVMDLYWYAWIYALEHENVYTNDLTILVGRLAIDFFRGAASSKGSKSNARMPVIKSIWLVFTKSPPFPRVYTFHPR
ncbi:MAG: hypothetical protein Q9194_002327 [Teloschistes cf. exilis]